MTETKGIFYKAQESLREAMGCRKNIKHGPSLGFLESKGQPNYSMCFRRGGLSLLSVLCPVGCESFLCSLCLIGAVSLSYQR